MAAWEYSPKIHHNPHKNPPLDAILNHSNPFHNITGVNSKIRFNIVPAFPRSINCPFSGVSY